MEASKSLRMLYYFSLPLFPTDNPSPSPLSLPKISNNGHLYRIVITHRGGNTKNPSQVRQKAITHKICSAEEDLGEKWTE
jgi:hypothetical protein